MRHWAAECAFYRGDDEQRCLLSWRWCRPCPYRLSRIAEVPIRDHLALAASRVNFRTMALLSFLAVLVSTAGLCFKHCGRDHNCSSGEQALTNDSK
jgi:hypothetical protein